MSKWKGRVVNVIRTDGISMGYNEDGYYLTFINGEPVWRPRYYKENNVSKLLAKVDKIDGNNTSPANPKPII